MLKICQNHFQPILKKSKKYFHVELPGTGGGGNPTWPKMKNVKNGLKMILANFHHVELPRVTQHVHIHTCIHTHTYTLMVLTISMHPIEDHVLDNKTNNKLIPNKGQQ